MKKITVTLDDDIYDFLVNSSFKEETTMKEIINRSIRDYKDSKDNYYKEKTKSLESIKNLSIESNKNSMEANQNSIETKRLSAAVLRILREIYKQSSISRPIIQY